MLVLSRREGDVVVVNDNIRVIVHSVRGNVVRLAFDCDRSIPIMREELIGKFNSPSLTSGVCDED